MTTQAGRTEIVFIDASLTDWWVLAESLPAGAAAVAGTTSPEPAASEPAHTLPPAADVAIETDPSPSHPSPSDPSPSDPSASGRAEVRAS